MRKDKKKILFYDCHTKAVEHLISLINDSLPKNKFQTKLLHFESIYENNSPTYIKIKDLDCYDFSFFKTFNVINILKNNRPCLIIFFDKGGLLDRAGLKAANFLKIPTLYVPHGYIPPISNVNKKNYYRNVYSLKYYLNNISRIIKIFRVYWETNLTIDRFYFIKPKTIVLLIALFINPHKFYYSYPDEIKFDKVIIYGQAHQKVMNENF